MAKRNRSMGSKAEQSLYQPPTETCGASAATDIQIVSPGDKSRVNGDTVSIKFYGGDNKTNC